MRKSPADKSIVITSIFNPTEAIEKFLMFDDCELIVVGDKKTPENWEYKGASYLSVKQQEMMEFRLAKVMPFNHYSRKMLGYLMAIQNGSEFIVDTDDDNIPKEKWEFPPFEGEFDFVPGMKGFINIYQLYTDKNIWARGLPLNLVTKKFDLEKELSLRNCRVGVWQGLADEDPDVDAIYRLTSDVPCYFNERKPIVLGNGTISPFNSQNTIFRKELFPLLYLPTYVTFRFTDILRGLAAQPIMWLYGYHLGFTNATVLQKRNVHDYMKDFTSEIPMYQHSESVIDIVSGSISSSCSMENNLFNAYDALLKAKIVPKEEMVTLEAWLKDLSQIT